MSSDRPLLFGRADLAERIAKAKNHMQEYRQQNDALWPYHSFAMTVGELLDAAERGLRSAPAPAPAEPVDWIGSINGVLLKLRAMADDAADRGDVFAQRVVRLLDAAPAAPAGWPEVSDLLGEACDMLDLIGCSPEGMSEDLQRASDLQARIRAALAAAPGAQGDAS